MCDNVSDCVTWAKQAHISILYDMTKTQHPQAQLSSLNSPCIASELHLLPATACHTPGTSVPYGLPCSGAGLEAT